MSINLNEELPSFEDQKPQEEIKKPEENKSQISTIPIDSSGKIVARNNSELLRYCNALLVGGGVPARFDTPQKLFAALMYVRELRLPDTAIRQVANIHGVMSCFGDLPLALAQREKGEMTYFKEQWFDKEYNVICFENKNLQNPVFGSVSFMRRRDGEIQSFSFTMDDAEKAGLYPPLKWNKESKGKVLNEDSPWSKYTPQMLRYRSRTIGLKSLFADLIGGISVAEFDFPDMAPALVGVKDVTPKETADDIIKKLEER